MIPGLEWSSAMTLKQAAPVGKQRPPKHADLRPIHKLDLARNKPVVAGLTFPLEPRKSLHSERMC
jgi:hypothetical protein